MRWIHHPLSLFHIPAEQHCYQLLFKNMQDKHWYTTLGLFIGDYSNRTTEQHCYQLLFKNRQDKHWYTTVVLFTLNCSSWGLSLRHVLAIKLYYLYRGQDFTNVVPYTFLSNSITYIECRTLQMSLYILFNKTLLPISSGGLYKCRCIYLFIKLYYQYRVQDFTNLVAYTFCTLPCVHCIVRQCRLLLLS